MMEAKATWAGPYESAAQFVGTASSGHALVLDAGDDKRATSPLEVVLVGLCACTASDVVSILRKKREQQKDRLHAPIVRASASAVFVCSVTVSSTFSA